jgi:hypothetical protein
MGWGRRSVRGGLVRVCAGVDGGVGDSAFVGRMLQKGRDGSFCGGIGVGKGSM